MSAKLIQDVPIADYVKKVGIEKQLIVQHLGDGAQIGALMLDKAWLHTGLWAPITPHATTMEDFFQVYAAPKYNALYKPETYTALQARMKEGVKPANDRVAFALGADTNYWHFVKDHLSRLAIYFAMPELNGAPLLVPMSFGEQQHAILKQVFDWAGRPLPPILRLGDEIAALGPTVFPSLISIQAAAKLWSGALKPPMLAKQTGQRLFITREGVTRRRLANQQIVAERLAEDGFRALDPGTLPFAEQVALFQGASIIVGVHGAALTNLLFAPDEAAFVELSPDRDQLFYRDLAMAKKMKVAQLAAFIEDGLPRDQHRDFEIRLDFVERAVTPLLEG